LKKIHFQRFVRQRLFEPPVFPLQRRFLGLLHFGTAEREPALREREPVESYVEFLS